MTRNRIFLIGAAGIGLAALMLFLCSVHLPLFSDPYSRVLLDRDGVLLGATVADDGQWRFPPSARVPEKYARAVVSFEDKRFRHHPGVDPLALVRALWQDVSARRIVSGGSTITMQVIRLARKGQPRTVVEKLIEIVEALRLETLLSKDRILGLYAAHAPFGGNVVGLRAAAWRYFGRSPETLSWAEAAMLAVLPNSPSLIYPGRRRKALQRKRDRLLDRMAAEGVIDGLTARLSKAEPLPPAPFPIPMRAPHLLFRAAADGRGTGVIRSTLDRSLQVRATQIVDRHSRVLAENRVFNAAALILDVHTGAVLAYVGNVSPSPRALHDNYVDIVTAPRSTGSILKPLLYAGMLQAGELLPSQLVADIPTRMGGFQPHNYTHDYSGAVPAYMALARSLNVPAVRMLRAYTTDRFYGLLKSLGMTTLIRPAADYGLSLILGGAEGTLWDITGIYAGMARRVLDGGTAAKSFFPPHYRRTAPGGPMVSGGGNAALSAPACWLALEAMLQVVRPGEDNAWRSYASARKIAWKTGTSYGFRDAWAVGVTPRYAVGVWVGNADGEGRPGLTGFTAAAPVLFELFSALGDTGGWFEPPDQGLVTITVCADSGFRAGPDCPRTRTIQAPASGLRTRVCPYCRLVHLDPAGRYRVHGDCQSVDRMRTEKRFVLPPVMEWYYRKRHSDYEGVPPWRADCAALAGGARSLSLIYPGPGERVYIPRELDGTRGRVVFEAALRQAGAELYWHLDNTYLGETRDVHRMAVSPAPGVHVLTVVDALGESVSRRFRVLSRSDAEGKKRDSSFKRQGSR